MTIICNFAATSKSHKATELTLNTNIIRIKIPFFLLFLLVMIKPLFFTYYFNFFFHLTEKLNLFGIMNLIF